jgi:hypothetical protein
MSVASGSASLAKSKASKAAAEAKSKKVGNINVKGYIGASGAGGGFGHNAPGFKTVKHFAGAAGGRQEVTVDGQVVAAWDLMLDDNSPTTWVLAEYDSTGKNIVLKSQGQGGLKTFQNQLEDGVCAWGGFKCFGVDKRGAHECKRAKFVFVMFKPEGAAGMRKAKMASHKGTVKAHLQGAHMDVTVEDPETDLDTSELITKLQAATGAHKPNGYEFEEGKFEEADYYGLGIGSNCEAESRF